jgi:outer membrane receptor protein involved in Fe transport
LTYRFLSPDAVTLERSAQPDREGPQVAATIGEGQCAPRGEILPTEPITVEEAGPIQGYKAIRAPTGTKTDTPILDVPFSIQVVPRQVIDDQNANRLADVAQNVSNVRPGNTLGNRTETFLIRGFPVSSFVEVSLGERWRLLLGGRYDYAHGRTKFKSDADRFAETTKVDDHAFSPRVGLVFQPISTVSLYASYARSLFPQLGATFEGTPFEPERGEQYEAGVKAELLNRRLTATLALFQLTRQNVLTDDPANPDFSIQTGEQRSRGIELDLAGQILPGWQVIASGAYTDAEITKDNVFPVGNRFAGVPTLSGSVWSIYEIGTGGLKGFGFGAGIFAAGRREGDLDNSFEVPGYVQTDATVYYRIKDYLRASLYFRNLFDVEYIETPVNAVFIDPGAPLTVLGKLELRF